MSETLHVWVDYTDGEARYWNYYPESIEWELNLHDNNAPEIWWW